MTRIDLVLLHAPSVYDFRERSIMFGPVSDMVPSTPIFEMYPLGFSTMGEYLERRGIHVSNASSAFLGQPHLHGLEKESKSTIYHRQSKGVQRRTRRAPTAKRHAS